MMLIFKIDKFLMKKQQIGRGNCRKNKKYSKKNRKSLNIF